MFTLRLPFELPEGYQITDTDKPIQHGSLEFKLKKETRLYALIVNGLASKEEANKFIVNAWSGLMWVLLNCGLAPKWETEPQTIAYAKDPVKAKNLSKSFKMDIEDEVHGVIDGSHPAIFESDGNFKSITAGNVNIISGTNKHPRGKPSPVGRLSRTSKAGYFYNNLS